jgi:hypothetical protein
MPRLPRRGHWTDAACYHVITRGHNRDPIFEDPDRAEFLGLLARSRDRFELRTAPRDRDMQGQRERECFNG